MSVKYNEPRINLTNLGGTSAKIIRQNMLRVYITVILGIGYNCWYFGNSQSLISDVDHSLIPLSGVPLLSDKHRYICEIVTHTGPLHFN